MSVQAAVRAAIVASVLAKACDPGGCKLQRAAAFCADTALPGSIVWKMLLTLCLKRHFTLRSRAKFWGS